MKDLKDICLVSKDVLRKWNQTPLVDYENDVQEALNQDLSGMVVVPLEHTAKIIELANEALERLDDVICYTYDYERVKTYLKKAHAELAMLSAAQKEKNND